MNLTVHLDPGHGWLEIPTSVLVQLQIVDQISKYSYLGDFGRTAYLEEDCDAPKAIEALEQRGIEPKLKYRDHNRDCFIRNLPSYTV